MRSSRFLALATLAAVICFMAVYAPAQDKQQSKINVLLISGDDIAPYHNWREISEKTREVLAGSPRFNVKVCEDPMILESGATLKNYDVIVQTLYNRSTPTISEKAKENLIGFVKDGKGFYVQHLGSASFNEWGEFGKLCGRYWVMGKSGHGPRSPFTANVVKKDHPITKGIKDFEIDDELYAKLQGDYPIEVLVSADSDWSKGTEALVFTAKYGKGRSVHNALGHDAKAILNANMQKLILRGVEWAATGKVAE